ncbi:hypothetical protein ANCCAN_04703 [Ancylostoma caninum]|uniref:Uncharacterized protein n=1 Tax=Ancylostoma caninum TaxID=29170 RepID=A0A368GXQ2_ANCCA|nr:hypothetical protein ANCCAN_04703 [Ancylostoma caninum]
MSIEQLESELEILRQDKKTQNETQTRLNEAQQSMRCLQTDISEKNTKIEELLVEQSRLEGELMCLNGKILEMERYVPNFSVFLVRIGLNFQRSIFIFYTVIFYAVYDRVVASI